MGGEGACAARLPYCLHRRILRHAQPSTPVILSEAKDDRVAEIVSDTNHTSQTRLIFSPPYNAFPHKRRKNSMSFMSILIAFLITFGAVLVFALLIVFTSPQESCHRTKSQLLRDMLVSPYIRRRPDGYISPGTEMLAWVSGSTRRSSRENRYTGRVVRALDICSRTNTNKFLQHKLAV